MKAFVEIKVEPGTIDLVLEALKKIEGVKEVYTVTGHCDIIAVVEVPDLKSLRVLVTEIYRSIKGVVSTETLVHVE